MPGAFLLREVGIAGGAPRTLRERPAPYRSVARLADGTLAWSITEPDRATGASTSRVETLGDDGQPRTIAISPGALERVVASPAGDGLFARRTMGGGRFGAPQTEDLVVLASDAVRSIAPLETKSGPRPRIAVTPSGSTILLGDAGRIVKIDARSGVRETVPIRARVTLELESATPPRVAPRPAPVIAGPSLMPGGGLIFEAAGGLWMQPPGGGTARRLDDRGAGPRAMAVSPALSADAKRLAFVRIDGSKMALCTMDLATGEVRVIASGSGYAQPAWSADGSRIAFVESAGFAATIVSVASDGGDRKEVGQALFWSARPGFSGDGRSLFFTTNVTGTGNVYRRPLADLKTSPAPVTALTRHASDGLVSPDGKWLAFRRNKEVYVAKLPDAPAPLLDADVRKVAEEGGDAFSFAADSSALVYAAGGHVYRQPLAAGPRAEIPVRLELPHRRPKPLLIRDARVLDFDKKGFGEPTSLLLDDGRIAWIGAERGRKIPDGADVLDAKGKFAIPGLFEMHAHASGANQAAFIAYGVTSVRDTGGTVAGSSELADRAESGDDPIPRFFFSGEIFEGETPYWGDAFLQIENEDDARAYVRRFKTAGASFIKVYPSLPWPLQLAAVDEARRAGLPVVGHGMGVNEIARSVTQGFTTIEHTVFPVRIHDDLIRLLAASDTRWDPTLAVVGGDSVLLRKEPSRLSDPKLLAFVPASALEMAKSSDYQKEMSDADLGRAWSEQLASIRAAHARGVKLAIGTDAPNPACFYGPSLHWEMEFFAAAGIPPIEVLRIATADAAKTLGATDLGVLAPGKLADVLLLDANPLESIKNTQAIWRTIKAGWVFDPAAMMTAE